MGKLIILVPLFFALLLVTWHLAKLLKKQPWGDDDKKEAWANIRAWLYAFGAAILMWWLVPSTIGGTGAVIGTILSSVLAIMIVLVVRDLPARMSRVDGLLWRDGWRNPWRRSGDPVPYVRWGRRFALLAFGLFVLVVALAAAISRPTSPATVTDGSQQRPVVTNTGTAAPAVPSTSKASPKTSKTPPKTIVNDCGGPTPVAVPNPTTLTFGTGNLQICHDGEWQNWSAFQPADVAPPQTMRLTAWTQDATYGYGVATVVEEDSPFEGTSYLIRTTDFK